MEMKEIPEADFFNFVKAHTLGKDIFLVGHEGKLRYQVIGEDGSKYLIKPKSAPVNFVAKLQRSWWRLQGKIERLFR